MRELDQPGLWSRLAGSSFGEKDVNGDQLIRGEPMEHFEPDIIAFCCEF